MANTIIGRIKEASQQRKVKKFEKELESREQRARQILSQRAELQELESDVKEGKLLASQREQIKRSKKEIFKQTKRGRAIRTVSKGVKQLPAIFRGFRTTAKVTRKFAGGGNQGVSVKAKPKVALPQTDKRPPIFGGSQREPTNQDESFLGKKKKKNNQEPQQFIEQNFFGRL